MRWLALAVLLCAARAAGDSISFPLSGYFHPGRAMPVQWDLSGLSGNIDSLQISADGAIPSIGHLDGKSHGILPWIAVDAMPRNIVCRIGENVIPQPATALRALDDSQKLVALLGADESQAAELFPGAHVVTVSLDEHSLPTGNGMSWATLDALVMSPPNYAALGPRMQKELYAAGVVLAVTQDVMPDRELPWQHRGDLWLASSGLPDPPLIDADLFDPTFSWQWGRTAAFRQRIVLLGALFCIVIAAAGLWKWRGRWVVLLSASAICFAGFAVENARWSPVASAGGEVAISESDTLDQWQYFQSHRLTEYSVTGDGVFFPVFSEEKHLLDSHAKLIAQGDFDVGLSFTLRPDLPQALVWREYFHPATEPNGLMEISPLRDLPFASLYRSSQAVILSQYSPD